MNKSWRLYPPATPEFARAVGLPTVVAQVLSNRGVSTPEEVNFFLQGPAEPFHDPNLLPQMTPAVTRLSRAIESGEVIGVFGDFDADGVTATAILSQGLEALGGQVAPYIPHRVSEGHGLNMEAVQALKVSGVSVIVTVDCGVSSGREVEFAADLSLDVIITDHHTPPPTLPPALAIIDPKIPGSVYPFDELTGAGLAFKLVQGLYRHLGKEWPHELLALAAIGTVADLGPLRGENRAIVKAGLLQLRSTRSPGLNALYRRARLFPNAIDSESIAFMIAPRLNAAGRLQHAISSYRLLTSASASEAHSLAETVEGFNKERQRNTETACRKALDMAKTDEPIILLADEEFAPGISGLVASRMVDAFNKPAVVMAIDGDVVRASARSIPAFNVIAAFEKCRPLFQRFGGHSMAAGFVMSRTNLQELRAKMTSIAREILGDCQPARVLKIDAKAQPTDLMGETYRSLSTLEPFGFGNPTPVFLARRMKIQQASKVGSEGQHLRLKLWDGRASWTAFAFRQGDIELPKTGYLDLAYSLSTNSWKGRRVIEMKVEDFRPSS